MKPHDNENIKYLSQLLGTEQWNAYLSAADAFASGRPFTGAEEKAYDCVMNCLTAMERFGKNRWWKSSDLKTIGYYQLLNPTLLVDFSKFHEAIELLLQRPVFTSEIGLNWDSLRAEAEKAFHPKEKSPRNRIAG